MVPDFTESEFEIPATIEFVGWPKIARLYRPVLITEKIDGTNAAIGVLEDGRVYAQSRKKIITPGKSTDNHGFARWVSEREDEIRQQLGVGLHFGEWYGSGIQRGYGLVDGEKRFALFNVKRWENEPLPHGMETTPLLYEGTFYDEAAQDSLDLIRNRSRAGSGDFDRAEGIVVFFTQPQYSFKVTLENDAMSKGEADALGLSA